MAAVSQSIASALPYFHAEIRRPRRILFFWGHKFAPINVYFPQMFLDSLPVIRNILVEVPGTATHAAYPSEDPTSKSHSTSTFG